MHDGYKKSVYMWVFIGIMCDYKSRKIVSGQKFSQLILCDISVARFVRNRVEGLQEGIEIVKFYVFV